MCVNIINGETNNHTIQEKEQPKNKRIFAMDNSAVILSFIVLQVMGFSSGSFHKQLLT